MRNRRIVLTPQSMKHATWIAESKVKDLLKMAARLSADIEKEQRLAQHLCKACYYRGPSIGGAAITVAACGCCGKEETYATTCTDALCLTCAQTHSLCKHCGGDIDMNANRKNWPQAQAE